VNQHFYIFSIVYWTGENVSSSPTVKTRFLTVKMFMPIVFCQSGPTSQKHTTIVPYLPYSPALASCNPSVSKTNQVPNRDRFHVITIEEKSHTSDMG
jgi:hypothetical protein